jgi:hypothetical protein
MPEFYDQCNCRYQLRVQNYLDAIARGVRDSAASRAFLLQETEYHQLYVAAKPLWQEQWNERDRANSLKCPFWSNYWFNPCRSCDCCIGGSRSMEIDAIFFLQNGFGQSMAMHVEIKRDREPLSHGQAEAYRPRAACYRDQRRARPGILGPDHFITVLVCGIGTDIRSAKGHFDRVILHQNAREMFPRYPSK